MATTLVDVTGNVHDHIDGEFTAGSLRVFLKYNTSYVVDPDAGVIRLGSAKVTPAADGSFTLPDVIASVDTVENLQATVYVEYRDTATQTRLRQPFGPYDLTAETGTVDLTELEQVQHLDASFVSVTMTQMQALLDEMTEISGLTGEDAAVAFLIGNLLSDVRGALNSLFMDRLSVAATTASAGPVAPKTHTPVDATAGPLAMTLDDATGPGQTVVVEKVDETFNEVTITGTFRDTTAEIRLCYQHQSVMFVSAADGSWWPIADKDPSPFIVGPPVATGTDTAQIQAVLDRCQAAVTAAGGPSSTSGKAKLQPFRRYVIDDTLVNPDNVVLDLQGSVLVLADGSDCDMVKSIDFDTLTGHNYWLTSEGVPTGFGFQNGILDGNRDNNTSGRGVVSFGKRLLHNNLLISNTAGDGWYSECGAKGGQDEAFDMPESNTGTIWIYRPGGKGVVIRGPHDARYQNFFISKPEDIGLHVEKSATYEGACDIGFVHVYASQTAEGVVLDTETHIENLTSESNYLGGLVANAACRIGEFWLFRNHIAYLGADGTAGHPWAPQSLAHMTLNFENCHLGIGRIRADFGGTGLHTTSAANGHIGRVLIGGGGTGNTGRGAYMEGSAFTGIIEVRGFNGDLTGSGGEAGIGYVHGGTASLCRLDVSTSNCKTHIDNDGVGGSGNFIVCRPSTQAGETVDATSFTGVNNLIFILPAGTGTNTPRLQFGTGNLMTREELATYVDRVGHRLKTALETLSRGDVPNSGTLTSGTLFLTYATADDDLLVGHIETDTIGGSTISASTLARVGIYIPDPVTGDITLVASCANDTSLWRAAGTTYSSALSVAYLIPKGTRYAVGELQVGGNATPVLYAKSGGLPNRMAQNPRMSGMVTGQTDLPSSVAVGSIQSSAVRIYAALKA